jgi:hypothetical protein
MVDRVTRWLRLGALLGGSALLWACVAPILTVPPPSAISFTANTVVDTRGASKTVWTTQGGPLAQAADSTFFVVDRSLGSGVIATARNDGSFTAPPMDGAENDPVLIYYRTPAGDYSDSICLLLAPGTSPLACPE